MNKNRMFLLIVVLAFASLACQAFAGGGNDPQTAPSSNNDGQTPSSGSNPGTDSGGAKSDTTFPLTKDAYNVTELGDAGVLYYTKLSLEDVMKFYRDEYTSRGYKERELLTVISDGTFSMVFDGDPSGKAIVLQSVDLGDGSRTVNIRFEDV